MTKEELYNLHYAICQGARHLMERKNADYANGDDPFLNFRATQNYNVHPAKGILIRMSDKMSRINSFIERGDFKVKDEGLQDTAIDIINYAVLLVGLLEESNSNDLKMVYDPSQMTTAEAIELYNTNYPEYVKQYEERKNSNDTTWHKEVDCNCGSNHGSSAWMHKVDCPAHRKLQFDKEKNNG